MAQDTQAKKTGTADKPRPGDPTPQNLLKRAGRAWANKSNWRSLLQEANEFALPNRNLYENPSPGQRKNDRIFDSTAVMALQHFANRLQSDLTPPFQKWAALTIGPTAPAEIKDEAQAIAEATTDALFAALHLSNFDTVVNEFYLDLGISTGNFMVMEGDDRVPIRCIAVPDIQVALEEGPFGTIDGVFRRHKLPARLVERTWAGAKIPDEMQTLIDQQDDKESEAEVELDECTFYDAKADIWVCQVIWQGTDEMRKNQTEPAVIFTGRYEECPWIITRWVKVAGETQGRGPVLMALPDIKTVNKVVELILKNASLAIAGVWAAADDGVINPNTIRIVPGAVIPVARNGGTQGQSLMPLEFGGRFDVAQLVLDDLRMNIKRMLLDNTLPPEAGPVRSATEIIERVKILQQDIGSPFGRLMSEFIRPFISRCLGILTRKGIIEPIKIDGINVQLTVTSPLARQQALDDVAALMRSIELTGAIDPRMVALGFKIEDLGEWIGEKLGAPRKLIRTKAERDALQQQAGTLMGMQQSADVIPFGRQGGQRPGTMGMAA